MPNLKPERPSDPVQLAVAVAREATGEAPPTRQEVREALWRLEAATKSDIEVRADLAILREWIEHKGD